MTEKEQIVQTCVDEIEQIVQTCVDEIEKIVTLDCTEEQKQLISERVNDAIDASLGAAQRFLDNRGE